MAIATLNDSLAHKIDSKHYLDEAIDIRGNVFSSDQLDKIAADIQWELGPDYFVQVERFPNPSINHIHIQYNGPKKQPEKHGGGGTIGGLPGVAVP